MKIFGIFKKRPAWTILAGAALVFCGAFFSCDNVSSPSPAPVSQPSSPAKPAGTGTTKPAVTTDKQGKKYITFTGSVGGSAGAVPAQMSALADIFDESASGSSAVSKSAKPNLDTGTSGAYKFFAQAKCGSVVVEGDFGTTSGSRSFTMGLEIGKTWNITCGVCAKSDGAVVLSDSYKFEASEDNAVLSHKFVPTPVKDGNGSVALEITVDASVSKAVAACSDQGWKDANGDSEEKELPISSGTASLSLGEIKSGSYDVTLNFFKSDGAGGYIFLYSIYQNINVFDNAATDTWISSGGKGSIATVGGKTRLVVDQDEIQAAASTILYVSGETESDAQARGAKKPDDSNSGSYYDPLASLGRAVSMINAAGSASKDYKIFICKTVEGNTIFPSDLGTYNSASKKAGSIEIASLPGASDAVIAGGATGGADPEFKILNIETCVPIFIKGVKIRRREGSGSSMGILVNAKDAAVTLLSGTEVSGNRLSSSGGGIYAKKGSVFVKGAKIYDNITGQEGAGVYVSAGASVEMSSGEISGNSSQNGAGGGVYVYFDSDDGAGSFTMTGGTISGNSAKNGGGIFLYGGSYASVTGDSEISGNQASQIGGGAIYNNGTLELSGSVSIPYGKDDAGNPVEKKNDIYLSSGKQIDVGHLNGSGVVAAIRPIGWDRGATVISVSGTTVEAVKDRFVITDTDFTINKSKTNIALGVLNAPIYVAGVGAENRHKCAVDGSDEDGVSGTKDHPFKTVGHAASKLTGDEDFEILIDGKIAGAQRIEGTIAATSIVLRGCNGLDSTTKVPKDSLDANGEEKSTLSVKTSVPITIQDLKITGGNKGYTGGDDNPNCGGGISLFNGASLSLADGAMVAGNQASEGGGVYVAEGASLYMYGTSYVGDRTTTTASGATLDAAVASNKAAYGGGISNSGNVYLGYKKEGSAIKEADWTGGVCRNYVSVYGGGIYNSKGDVKMRAGKISYNYSHSQFGGGLCAGQYTPAGKGIELLGGELKENVADAGGGAVLVWSSFSIKGSPSIPYGGANGKNDIYLKTDGNTVTISGNLTLPDGATSVATIASTAWKRKRKFLSASSEALITGNKDKIALSVNNDGWNKDNASESSTYYAIIDSPIYVAGNSNRIICTKDGSDGDYSTTIYGTKADPFKTISKACSSLFEDSSADYEILIDGDVKGVQEIPSSVDSKAASVTLRGVKKNASGAVVATAAPALNANIGSTASDSGTALTVNTKKSVTITDLTITGGNTTKNGGGIYVAAGANVTLADGANVTNNHADSTTSGCGLGGGVYVAAGSGSVADGALYMNGGAVVGVSGTLSGAVASNTAGINTARNGAGVYNAGGLYLGYKQNGASYSAQNLSGGVIGNYTSNVNGTGGGVYNAGTLKLASGNVSYNKTDGAYAYGVGVYNAGTFDMTGGEISGNKNETNSSAGGGVYTTGSGHKFTMSAGAVVSNWAQSYGGGVYVMSSSEFEMSGTASVSSNKTSTSGSGGGIYLYGGTFTLSGGTITSNANAKWGKGVHVESGTFNMKGAAVVDSTNDVYLNSEKTITIADTLNASGSVATVTLKNWKRGTKFLSSSSANASKMVNAKSKFTLSNDNDGWDKNDDSTSSTADTRYAWISSPIYVASSGTDTTRKVCSAPPSDATKATGTKKMPYATIAAALKDTDLAYESNTITIDGSLSAQTIANTTTVADGVSAVTLQGYKASGSSTSAAAINGGGTSSALSISKNLTYTIKDLQITNGKANAGGGINITAGTVNLDSGAKVSGNKASSSGTGAGVYVASGATLNIKSGSEIYSNVADSGNINGGGVYNLGTVNIYSESKLYKNTANYGGAIYNKGTLSMSGGTIGGSAANANTAAWGGGIYNDASKSLIISGGELSYNSATNGAALGNAYGGAIMNYGSLTISGAAIISNNTASETNTSQGYAYGGGIYNASSGSVEITGALTMYANKATVAAATSGQSTSQGGAIFNAGTLTMSKGTIGASGKLNTVTGKSVTVLQGGAIYQNGTFNISGTAYVYPGTETSNDVCLPSGKFVKVVNSWTGSQASSKMALTPATWKRGTQVLDGDYAAAYYTYFKTTDIEWSVGYKETSWSLTGDLKKCIGADIYVAGAGCASGITAPSSTASERVGTKAKPFNSISEGVNACWNTGLPFTINFSGTISGTAQTIPAATATTGLASAITIQGVTGNTSDIIDRNLTTTSSSTGTALTINSTTSVTLKNIKITKGYSSTNGGGITVNTGASLTLGEGVSITANKATSNGGGIYSVGTVDMTSGSVTNNSAQNGGGIYSSGTLYVRGSAIVGDKTETHATGSTAGTNCSNSASASGGGIYNSGTLYFGCNMSGTKDADNGYALDSGYGVWRNYANDGGGIYNTGTFKSGSGSISYNYAPNSAGGLYAGGSTNNMGGLGVSYNKTGKNGAGVYVASSKSAEVTAQSGVNHNTATASSGSSDVCGGGIYVAGTLTTTETLNANWNSASITGGSGKAYGGCVYIASGGKFVYSKGQLGGTSQSNTVSNTVSGSTDKAYGGSIYQDGTFEVSAKGYIPKGSLRSDDVYLPSEKYITVTGELKTNSELSQMTITPATWKRGTKVLSRGSSLSVDDFKGQIAKFKGSETDWLAVYNLSVGKLYTSYKIYVSQSGYDDDKNGLGTSAKPYKTISKAVGECWTTGSDFTVYVSGTIKGAHTIGGTDVTINAKSLTLEGTGTSPTIDAEKTSGIRPLTINTSLGVTIKNLTITNGNVTPNYGGGIYIEGGCALTLDDGASVLSNKASSGGGGVYVDASSTLIMKSGSTINKNVSTGGGGGVYNNGKVLMSGTARIGANGTSKPGTSSTSPTGNYAGIQGGGIYNAGTVCLGYTAWTNETTNTPKKLEGGVTQNYASSVSGGIYVSTAAKVYMKTGNISYNRANNGGGMTNATGTVKLLGGRMESNWADSNKSGAIWQNGDLYLGGDVYIPYGGSLGLNDLYLNDKSVQLNTDIAPPEDCTTGVIATIYPNTYAGIGVVGQNYAYAPCLAVVPQPGTTPPQAWTINTTNGYLKKTTAITSSNISSVVSGLSSGAELKADSTFGNDALETLKTALGSTSNTIKLDLSQSSVTSLSDNTKIPSCLESIVLPNNFAAYGLLWQGLRSNSKLKTIEVSPQNKKLASDSGILYGLDDNGKKVRLVLYPASKTGSSYTLPSGVITLGGGCFWGNKYLTGITNLTQITQIDNYGNQFRLCEKITSINLPNVTTTGDYGYGFIKGCPELTTVTLASTLTTLEGNCFSECLKLTTIHFKSTTPPTINSSDPKLFSDCNASLMIYVPSSSRNAWLSATGTYGFANSAYNALAGSSLSSKVYGE